MRFPKMLVGAFLIGFALESEAQTASNSDAKPKVFEIVSIKPDNPGTHERSQALPNGVRYPGITIDLLVREAYDTFNESQVVGMPSWARSDRYDFEARVDAGTANEWSKLSTKERWKQEQPMFQALLADRCKLTVHFESKELAVYDLVIGKGGLKLKESSPDEKSVERVGNGNVTGRAITIENFTHAIPADGRLIVDKTETGDKKFDFDLKWAPDNRPIDVDSGPSLFTALEEQLGLKLVPTKATENVLVIDHIEKPSPN